MKIIALEEHVQMQAVIEAQERRGLRLSIGGGPTAEWERQLHDVGAGRLADMDAAGITMQVLSLNSPATQGLPVVDAVPLARDANDLLAKVAASHPDRFAGFATLPTSDPEASAEELARATQRLGLKGAMLHGAPEGRFLDDPVFAPILATAERLDVPLYLHPAPPLEGVRAAYYSGFSPAVSGALATAGWGWHIETGVHVLRLILAGVFDRHPGLRIIVGHMGEALPFMLARSTERLSQTMTRLDRSIEEYVRDHIYITTSGFFTLPPLLTALLTLGIDHIMFSVDYPYSANAQGRAFLDGLPLSPADIEKLAHSNAERLLKL